MRRPFTSSACPTHTPTSSPLARKRPPPDRPCSGIFSVIKNGRRSRLSLSSNETVSTSRVFQLVSLVPRSIPIEVTMESAGGSCVVVGEPSHVRQRGHLLDPHDGQVGGGVGGRQGRRDRARPCARRRRLSLHAEIVPVQLDEDRSFILHHVCGGQDQGLAVDRGDDRAAPLRRSSADDHRRPVSPVVGWQRRPPPGRVHRGGPAGRRRGTRAAIDLGPGGTAARAPAHGLRRHAAAATRAANGTATRRASAGRR